MCPLENEISGINKSSSDDRPGPGICDSKGRTECQGLGQSPNKIKRLGGLRLAGYAAVRLTHHGDDRPVHLTKTR